MPQQIINTPDDIVYGPHNKASPSAAEGDAWKTALDKIINNFGDHETRVTQNEDDIAAIGTNLAPLDSPVFTGDPRAPTPSAGDNDTSIATTAYVQTELADYAPLDSPALTGTPTAPTASEDDNSTQIATTAYVDRAVKWTLVEKTADQNTTSATLADDNELTFAMEANETYAIRGAYFVDVAGGGIYTGITGPASPTFIAGSALILLGVTGAIATPAQSSQNVDSYGTLARIASSFPGTITFDIVVQNGSNAGTFKMQIAQNSASTGCDFKAGSWLEYRKIT